MSAIAGGLWSILTSYRPNAARDRKGVKALRFGAFKATYRPSGFGFRRPRTDQEAQQMYNHVRTVAFWLDAAPVLADLGLPFRAGLDDIISLVPIYGDIVSGILQLYQVWLSFIFGVPRNILGLMLLNVVLDVLVGLVPILGDFLDNLFKSNLRNLALLEDWLLKGTGSKKYHILIMPESNEFIPQPQNKRSWSSGWFGGNGKTEVEEEMEAERVRGGVQKTRRMRKDEGEAFGAVPVSMDNVDSGTEGEIGGGTPDRTGPARSTRSRRAR